LAIVKAFAETGMGRSVTPPEVREVHTYGGITKPIAFAIGSGNAGKSFVWRLDDSLFQSPLSWYRQKNGLDLSPGYEHDPQPGFYRPIEPECLTCHAAATPAVAGTQNRYTLKGVPASIDCARCHGPGEAHAAKPARANIVNPARLPPTRRNSVCESCHLGGEARIPNPAKTFSDFQPGMALEEVFSVYVSGAAEHRVTGHVEQLAAAPCAKDPKLWCGSCHDPHRKPAPVERASFYRARCVQCHSVPAHERELGVDCAGCHMPRSQSYDGGHTAFTDHRIGARIETQGVGIRPWRPGANDQRGLALAYMTLAEKRQSLENLQEAARRINTLLAGKADGAILTAAAVIAMKQGKARQAIPWLEKALAEEPGSSRSQVNLAAALLAAGDKPKAAIHAKEAMRIEPLLPESYSILGQAEPARAAAWKALYQKRFHR
jgi:hypothetical protein